MFILETLKNPPTCFDHYSDHLQGARMFLVKFTYLLTPWSRALLEKLTGSAASQEIRRIFGSECSSPYSQVPATCPYPEPTPSSPHNPLPLPENPS